MRISARVLGYMKAIPGRKTPKGGDPVK